MQNKDKFSFEISLSVLNHLGRNLYRNFITVLGEAISNSWDADANNVWISINKNNSSFFIKDDGCGMDSNDFQNKFLKIGYSKRKDRGLLSPNRRPFIGAKGIGKLALLSCAKVITVISKTSKTDYTGGVIDNTGLTKAIEHDLTPDKYELGKPDLELFSDYTSKHKNGTIIHFEHTKEDIKNTVPYLRKLIALYFRFSLIDKSFKIFVNNEIVTFDDIKNLSDNTEFLWNINNLEDPYIKTLKKLKNNPISSQSTLRVKGFIATVEKPRNLKISGTEEKIGIDLFVNGRLRERNILKYLPSFSTRHIASYLYGQIHFDDLDKDGRDRFNTSRDGVLSGDEKYGELIDMLRDKILEEISNQWDELRLARDEEGDDENPRKGLKERRALSLYNISSKEYSVAQSEVNKWIKEMQPDAEFNIPAYVDCFLSENLVRRHIEKSGLCPTSCTSIDPDGKTCIDRYDTKNGNTSLCEYCKGEKGKQSLQQQKSEAETSIQIRDAENNLLMYLDYIDLAKITNSNILKDEDKSYKLLRNSVMHTSQLTAEAKTKLISIFDNIAATVKQLVGKKNEKGS